MGNQKKNLKMLGAGKVILGANAATWAPQEVLYEQKYNLGVMDAEMFVAGLIEGLIQKDDLPEIKKCMTNTETVSVEVTRIVNEMSAGTMAAILEGVKDIYALINELPTDLKDCENIQGDITKVVENVMANWSGVQADIAAINSNIQSSKYEAAGESTADVIILAAGKIQYSEINKEVNDAILASAEMYSTLY